MFKKKLIVALCLLPPFLLIWWSGGIVFQLLFAIFTLIAADEGLHLFCPSAPTTLRVFHAFCSLSIYCSLVFYSYPLGLRESLLLNVVIIFIVHMWSSLPISMINQHISGVFFASIYASLPISFLVIMRMNPLHGLGLTFLTLAAAWLCDSFAYIGGMRFGRTKLYPKLSPNKSVEGLLIGMSAAGIGAMASGVIFHLPFHILTLFVVGFFAGAIGQIGDLAESMLKRSASVKDTGKFLPGHGGVLDRFDAVLFIAPFIYFVYHFAPR